MPFKMTEHERELHRIRNRRYKANHPDRVKAQKKKTRLLHYVPHPRVLLTPEERKEHQRQNTRKCYRKHYIPFVPLTEEQKREHLKEHWRKVEHRRRGLGHNIIWKPSVIIESMVQHHIDFSNVIIIPERIHKTVCHSPKTGRGMKEINELVFQYIISQNNSCGS